MKKRAFLLATPMLLAACTAQPATPMPPLPTLDFSAYPTPTLVPFTPVGTEIQIGYKIQG